jgi:COP9 signalosome complex subunit 3
MDVVEAYKKGDVSNLGQVIAKHTATFTEDTNMGLIKQCTAKLTRRNIKRLTETFLTLSLEDIAKRVELPDAKAAEVALVGMIADNEIFATINQLTCTVSFHDDPEEFITFATTAQLQKETTEAAELYEKMMELDTELRTSKAYIKKTAPTTKGPVRCSFFDLILH